MYGLSVGGSAAADRMLALILELLPAPGEPLEEGNPLETAADGSSIGLYRSKWQVLTSALVFCRVQHAVNQPATLDVDAAHVSQPQTIPSIA